MSLQRAPAGCAGQVRLTSIEGNADRRGKRSREELPINPEMYTTAKISNHVDSTIKHDEDVPFVPRIAESVSSQNHSASITLEENFGSESENNPPPHAKVSLFIPQDFRTTPTTINRGKDTKSCDGDNRSKIIDNLASRPRAVLSSPDNDELFGRQNLTKFELRHHYARPKSSHPERHCKTKEREMNSHKDGRLRIPERKLKTSEPRRKLFIKSSAPTV